MALKVKRSLSYLLTVLMLLTLFPMSVFAAGNTENAFGITGENIIATEIPKEDNRYLTLSEGAAKRGCGFYPDNESPIGVGVGAILSACHIQSTDSSAPKVTITMKKPDLDSGLKTNFAGWVVLALLDGKIVTYPVQETPDGNLEFDVRLGSNGTDLALSYVHNIPANPWNNWGTLELKPGNIIKHESLGYVREYTLTYTLSDHIANYLKTTYKRPINLVFYLNSTGLKIDAETVSFGENKFFELNSEETKKLDDGRYMFTVEVNQDAWIDGEFSSAAAISYAAPNSSSLLFEGELWCDPDSFRCLPGAEMLGCVPLPITVVQPESTEVYRKITVIQSENGEISPRGVEDEVWVKDGEPQTFTITPDKGYHIKDVEVDGKSVGAKETYTFESVTDDTHTITAVFEENPTVTITPADMTIYMGGDKGYEGVVDGSGGTTTSNSLPEPLFKISAPSDVEPTELTFTNETTQNSWTVEKAGGQDYYRLVSTAEKKNPIRVQFIGEDDLAHDSDTFVPTDVEELFANYDIAIFSDEEDVVTVTDTDKKEYNISRKSGTLTVRAVADSEQGDDPTIDVIDENSLTKVETGKAVAVAPEGTTYTLNNTGVLVADANPSLLFDSIIDDQTHDRTKALQDRIKTEFGADTEIYEIKYLDLVDANNGNAWIKASTPVDIYWGYPEGTDQNTQFKIVHFKDLHRDGINSGYDISDIKNCGIETIQAQSTEQGIKFSVGSGGFSPFALVYEENQTPPEPPTRYRIEASAGPGGSINPEGIVRVSEGGSQHFTITPDEGYKILDVVVDGKSVGPVDEYTFKNVREWHTIEVTFTKLPANPDDSGVSDWLDTENHMAYLNGYPGEVFGPKQNMTRAEAAQMFYNLLLEKNVPITVSFTDVNDNAWYAKAVNTLASLGMIQGVEGNRFEPDRSITRAEFTAIAMRFTDGDTKGENIFSDVHPDQWFYDEVVGSIQYGWINGYEDDTFRPNNTITRAEVATITNRMLDREADRGYVDTHTDELRLFSDVDKGYWAYYTIVEASNAHEYTKDHNNEFWKNA